MEKLNKFDLIEIVAEEAHLSKKDAKASIDALVDTIKDSMRGGREINISNFGSFVPLTKKSRKGTDPSSHKSITIKEKRSVSFKIAKSFKKELNAKND